MATLQHADKYIFWFCLILAAGLFIGSFFCPPLGVIDGSILKAGGILVAMQALGIAEPIVTEITDTFRDYYQVADFGTEQAIPAKDAEGDIIPSAAFSADIIYQFNAVDMIREHELEITELQNIIATMQAQLASLTK